MYIVLRNRAYEDAAATLNLVTNSAASHLDVQGLENVHGPVDAKRPEYQRVRRVLQQFWRRNHFDLEGQWGRFSVIRFDRRLGSLVKVVSQEGDSQSIGKSVTTRPEIWEAVTRGEAVAQRALTGVKDHDGWMHAYSPLPGHNDSPQILLLHVELNEARLHRQLLINLGTLVLGSLFGLVLAVFGGWFLAAQITKPLRAFIDVMHLMQTTGDFDLRIDLHPEDREMTVLEHTFTRLVSKMNDARKREEGSYWSTLQALVTALDVRDNETAGHSLRVTRYSLVIGERLHLNTSQLEQVRHGALLHDIGKIGVPDAILRKTEKLTPDEWVAMRKHPDIGKNFLEGIEFLRPAIAVVYCHHERWDGTGYPQGLAQDNIPVAARIFAVADTLDTITSDRYYKKARSFSEAQKEIEACSGTQFDPAIVRAFLNIPEKVFLRIKTEAAFSALELETLRGATR